jgi:hypothetical protein
METSRFPCKRLLRMPGLRRRGVGMCHCDIDTRRVAFCGTENISTPNLSYAAQYLACALPCERFTSALTGIPCITRGGAVRYSFTVTDFHRLPFAGLPAHPSIHEPIRRGESFKQEWNGGDLVGLGGDRLLAENETAGRGERRDEVGRRVPVARLWLRRAVLPSMATWSGRSGQVSRTQDVKASENSAGSMRFIRMVSQRSPGTP